MDNIYTTAVQGLLGSSSATPAQQAAVQQAIQKILADPNQMTTITGQNKGGSNAWLWQPTEQNTKYQDYQFGGQNNYLTGEVAKYLKALGYSGATPEGGNISDQDAQAINQFLQERGLSVQTGTHQLEGASQHTGIQRIIDANGNPLAVDARNNRYDGNDRFTDIAKAGALAAAAYGVSGMLGGTAGAGAAPAAGAGVAPAAGGVESLMGSAAFGAAPEGLSVIPGALGSIGAASPTAYGALGGLAGGSAAFTLPAVAATGGGLLAGLGGIGKAIGGVGSAIGGIANAVGGAGNLAGIVGGIAGAMDGGKDQTATTSQQIDPRMAQYIYGTGYGDKNSLLGAAQDWFKNNQSGMNANMQAGVNQMASLYSSPQYAAGYNQMRDVGQGLLGRTIAGNPFTQGGLLGAVPAQQGTPSPDVGVPPQMMQRPPTSLLQGSPQMPSPDVGLQKFNRPAWSI